MITYSEYKHEIEYDNLSEDEKSYIDDNEIIFIGLSKLKALYDNLQILKLSSIKFNNHQCMHIKFLSRKLQKEEKVNINSALNLDNNDDEDQTMFHSYCTQELLAEYKEYNSHLKQSNYFSYDYVIPCNYINTNNHKTTFDFDVCFLRKWFEEVFDMTPIYGIMQIEQLCIFTSKLKNTTYTFNKVVIFQTKDGIKTEGQHVLYPSNEIYLTEGNVYKNDVLYKEGTFKYQTLDLKDGKLYKNNKVITYVNGTDENSTYNQLKKVKKQVEELKEYSSKLDNILCYIDKLMQKESASNNVVNEHIINVYDVNNIEQLSNDRENNIEILHPDMNDFMYTTIYEGVIIKK